jgi:hypothetical protein
MLLDRGKGDDRVDPVPRDAQLQRELDVAPSDEVDERGHRRLRAAAHMRSTVPARDGCEYGGMAARGGARTRGMSS